MSRSALLTCIATSLALQEAHLSLDQCDRSRVAIAYGTAFGSLTSVYEFDAEAVLEGKRYVDAMNFPNTVMNAPAGYAAALYGVTGVNATLSTGFSSGLEALRYGMRLLNRSQADTVLVGGYEQLSALTWGAFDRAGRLKNAGEAMPLPFDRRRNGFVPSEGAAIFILERKSDAVRRQAPILAEICGIGVGVPKLHANRAELVAVVSEAFTQAIHGAGLRSSALSGVIAGANGSLDDDQIEAEAIAQVIGSQVPVTAPKSILGESAGAGSAIGLACAISCLTQGRLCATAGFQEKETSQRIWVATSVLNGRPFTHLLVDGLDLTTKTIAVVISRADAR